MFVSIGRATCFGAMITNGAWEGQGTRFNLVRDVVRVKVSRYTNAVRLLGSGYATNNELLSAPLATRSTA